MGEIESTAERRGRRAGAGGREARRAVRSSGGRPKRKFISRKVPLYETLSEEGLALIEHNAETVLEEIGIEFREDPEALEIWKKTLFWRFIRISRSSMQREVYMTR